MSADQRTISNNRERRAVNHGPIGNRLAIGAMWHELVGDDPGQGDAQLMETRLRGNPG